MKKSYFGRVNLSAIAHENGINISFEPTWRSAPEKIILHVPFFVQINNVSINGTDIPVKKDCINLPGEKCKINISWKFNSTINYSYRTFVNDYKQGKI